MSISQRIISALKPLNIPITLVENPVRTASEYIVLIPIADTFSAFANDRPLAEINEMELAVYIKGNYLDLIDKILKQLITAELTITDRRYVEYEAATKFHHYVIDVAMENLFTEDF